MKKLLKYLAIGFVSLLVLSTIINLTVTKPKNRLHPDGSELGNIENALFKNSNVFFDNAVLNDGKKVPFIEIGSLDGKKVLVLGWNWSATFSTSTESIFRKVNKILKNVSTAPEMNIFPFVELQVHCELTDQYGKVYTALCGQVTVAMDELKKVDFANIDPLALSKLINKVAVDRKMHNVQFQKAWGINSESL